MTIHVSKDSVYYTNAIENARPNPLGAFLQRCRLVRVEDQRSDKPNLLQPRIDINS